MFEKCKNLSEAFDQIFTNFSKLDCYKNCEEIYTYHQLKKRTDNFVSYLTGKKVTTGDIILLFSDKSFDSYALMVACLRIGAAYCNLDPNNPLSRNIAVCEKLNPKYVFTDLEDLATIKIPDELELISLSKVEHQSESSESFSFSSSQTAYIMFTSGSTGVPKGSKISHSNIFRFLDWSLNKIKSGSGDRFAQISPLYFDNSVFDFYTALFSGSCLVPIKKKILDSPFDLVEYIDNNKCTIWFSVPSLYIYLLKVKVFRKGVLSSIRYFIFGGEGFPKQNLQKVFNLYSSHAKFLNVYGPTEATCICSSYDVQEQDFRNIDGILPIGRMNPHFDYQVTNDGELILIGPNIGDGYINDERSAKVFFLQNEQRCYRTGDLVKEKDGLMFFVGRKDNQIKHMGYRIELEEIEVAIKKVASLDEVAVIYQRKKVGYGKIVAAYSGSKEVNLKEKLKEQLPPYMIPNIFIRLENLPRNANGKVDRKRIASEL